MLYIWTSNKTHRRNINVYGEGRDKGKVVGFSTIDIKKGDTFEPSEEEIKRFGDCMRPFGESLRVQDAPREHETEPAADAA